MKLIPDHRARNNRCTKDCTMKRTLLLCLALAFTPCVMGQTDTLQIDPSREVAADETRVFRPQQLVAPAALIALGTWGLADGSPIDRLAQTARYDMNPRYTKIKADAYLQYVPTGVHLVLGFIPGTKPRHNFRDRVLASATANLLMAAVTNTVKYTVRERRPDSYARNSFFSGHTATAFTGAELVRIEYGWGYGSAAYAVATTTAFLRVWNKRHWVGDVVAGAGAGILCAQAGYWMLPVWKRWFGIDRRDALRRAKRENRPLVVGAPFYLPGERVAGVSCSIML